MMRAMDIVKRLATVMILSMAAVSATFAAATSPELGPPVGASAPHTLAGPTVDGETAGLAELSGEKGLALFFVRSLDWCPYCKKQAIDVNGAVDAFEARGLKVAFVSYDAPQKQRAFAEKWRFRPALLSDQTIEIINAFGLRNMSYEKGSRHYGIPYPAVFILDRDGVIRAKLYEEDYAVNDASYRTRPAVDIILAEVDRAFAPK